MSINIVNPAPKVQPFGVIERANGFNSGAVIVWDSGQRMFNPGYVKLYAVGTDYALVDALGDNIAPSATFTQLSAPSSGTLSAVYDRDESTSATWNISSSNQPYFAFDLGVQKPVFIGFLFSSSAVGGVINIYGSNDNSTWTFITYLPSGTAGTIYRLVAYGNYRYFKATSTGTTGWSITIYEVEIWNPGNTLKTFSTTTATHLLALVNNASYQVLEVVYP